MKEQDDTPPTEYTIEAFHKWVWQIEESILGYIRVHRAKGTTKSLNYHHLLGQLEVVDKILFQMEVAHSQLLEDSRKDTTNGTENP